MNVAQTILQQLGGSRFIAMTGSKNFVGSDNSLSMKLPRNKKSISHLTITLSNDLYTMTFIRLRMVQGELRRTVIAEYTDIYNDQLRDIFTSETGLYTNL